MLEGVVFIGILFLGLAYVWAKGDLDWVLAFDKSPYQPPEARERVHRPNVQEIVEALDGPEADGKKDTDDEEAAEHVLRRFEWFIKRIFE